MNWIAQNLTIWVSKMWSSHLPLNLVTWVWSLNLTWVEAENLLHPHAIARTHENKFQIFSHLSYVHPSLKQGIAESTAHRTEPWVAAHQWQRQEPYSQVSRVSQSSWDRVVDSHRPCNFYCLLTFISMSKFNGLLKSRNQSPLWVKFKASWQKTDLWAQWQF